MKNLENKFSIIGAGWLGEPLLKEVHRRGWDVVATKQTEKGIQELVAAGYKLFPFAAEKGMIRARDGERLFRDRVVIITLPPSSNYGEIGYLGAIQNCARLAKQFGAKEIIFTSSTSVYGDASGVITEMLPPMPKRESAYKIVSVERWLLNEFNFPVRILRLGGLIGNGRHPIFSLSGKRNIPSPHNVINLLHIRDLIRAIIALVSQPKVELVNSFSEPSFTNIYNLVTPLHLTRQSYYEAVAQVRGIPAPEFKTEGLPLKRIIDGSKITAEYDFYYQELDLIHADLEIL